MENSNFEALIFGHWNIHVHLQSWVLMISVGTDDIYMYMYVHLQSWVLMILVGTDDIYMYMYVHLQSWVLMISVPEIFLPDVIFCPARHVDE